MGSKKKNLFKNEKQKVNPNLTKPIPHFWLAVYLWLPLSWILTHLFRFFICPVWATRTNHSDLGACSISVYMAVLQKYFFR